MSLSTSPSRRFRWVSALQPECSEQLESLQRSLNDYYANQPTYFDAIDFTRDNWIAEDSYRWIREAIKGAEQILEIGCGRANVLRHVPLLEERYSGVDLSAELMRENAARHPGAAFSIPRASNELRFEKGEFDLVYSIFVLEHCVFPHKALDEWVRVLGKGGRLLILCPEVLASGLVASQRVGFSAGTGREKLARGKVWDALVTAADTRLRMPARSKVCLWQAKRCARFFINLAPTCFTDPFRPDVDAVYLTCKEEIVSWLRGRVAFSEVDPALRLYLQERRLLLLDGRKTG